MKEITRIHLVKIPYEIEIGAKKDLEKYLDALRKYSGDEIFGDVEIRITEILAEAGISKNGVISSDDVKNIRAQIGEPEVFRGDDFENSAEKIEESAPISKKLYRDEQNQMLAGVLAGVARYFDVDVAFVRLGFVALVFLSFGWAVIFYIAMAIIVPPARNASDILRLRGQKISANSIKEINENYDFEKTQRRKNFIARLFAAIGGIFAMIISLSGVAALFFGNMLLDTFHQRSGEVFSKDALLILQIVSNIAGVIFVAFFAILAFSGMMFRMRKSLAISLAVLAILGISLGVFMRTFSLRETFEARERILRSLKTTERKIDAEKLSKIKNLQIENSTSVDYVVSDERKIEISEYSALNEENFSRAKFDFEGETLKINLKIEKENPFASEYRIKIYGPEISKIDLGNLANLNYDAVGQRNLEIRQGENSSVTFAGQKIENLKIAQEKYARFTGYDAFVQNLTADSRGGNVHLEEIGRANFETRSCKNSSEVVNFALRKRAEFSKIILNGSEFNESRTGECFILEEY